MLVSTAEECKSKGLKKLETKTVHKRPLSAQKRDSDFTEGSAQSTKFTQKSIEEPKNLKVNGF